MSHAKDRLKLAEALLAMDDRRRHPRQVNLRGAISNAYYALFHLLIEAAVSSAIGKSRAAEARGIRNQMARWYPHTRMKETSRWFRRAGKVPDEIVKLLGYSSTSPRGIVPTELERVATAFSNLQEARHRADYDLSVPFSRREARDFLAESRAAFEAWELVAESGAARLFLVLLLTGKEPVQAH